MAVNGDNYVDRAPSSFGVYDVIHEKDITPYRDVLYADEIVSTSAFKTKGDAINFLVEKSLVSQEELTENAFVQTLSQKDKSILANLFDDKTRLTLIKTGRVSLYGIQLRCRMEFDSKPIPSIPINCDLAIKSVSGKFELCLIPKDGVTPIGPLNKYVDDGGGVLVQAIKADLIKASRKTHEQNKNIAENIIKHKK